MTARKLQKGMHHTHLIGTAVGALLTLTTFISPVTAQSTDRDNPTQLISNEVMGQVAPDNQGENFYTFIAGPGEVVVTLDVQPKNDVVVVDVDLFNTDAKEILSFRGSTSSKSERVVKRVQISSRHPVIMRVTSVNSANNSSGTYRVRIEGAVQLGVAQSQGGGVDSTNSAPSPTQPGSSSAATTFQCVSLGTNYATVAKRAERTTPPMITWKSTEFGSQYTPQQRCNIVSNRLNQVVAANGGRLKNLQLTYGPVKGTSVICYVNSRNEICNSNNILLTLRKSDRGREREILQQLVTFSLKGTGTAVQQSAPQYYAPFGEEIERSLGAEVTTQPVNPSVPGTQQAAPSSDPGL